MALVRYINGLIIGNRGERGFFFEMAKWDYDTNYFKNMLEMYAGSGLSINLKRWAFIGDCLHEEPVILDYGSGCGMFGLFKPDHVVYDSYDIGHIGDAPYPQTGIRHDRYRVVCFWDVLEHIDWQGKPDQDILDMMGKAEHVAVTLPIHPTNEPAEGWKHWKPGEHLTYFAKESFIEFMKEQSFELLLSGQPECPPRKDIYSFLFRRLP